MFCAIFTIWASRSITKTTTILDDIVILDPHWIIDALYVVLKNTKVKENCGIFTKEFVCNLWANAGYSKISDHKFLLRLMQKGQFEVAYKKENKNEYVAPILLPDETPKYEFDETNAIQIYFQYTFMPPGIFSRLVVRLNEIIAKQNGKQIVWKKGVLFERENAVAEVIESEHQKRITIKVFRQRISSKTKNSSPLSAMKSRKFTKIGLKIA